MVSVAATMLPIIVIVSCSKFESQGAGVYTEFVDDSLEADSLELQA